MDTLFLTPVGPLWGGSQDGSNFDPFLDPILTPFWPPFFMVWGTRAPGRGKMVISEVTQKGPQKSPFSKMSKMAKNRHLQENVKNGHFWSFLGVWKWPLFGVPFLTQNGPFLSYLLDFLRVYRIVGVQRVIQKWPKSDILGMSVFEIKCPHPVNSVRFWGSFLGSQNDTSWLTVSYTLTKSSKSDQKSTKSSKKWPKMGPQKWPKMAQKWLFWKMTHFGDPS